MERLVEFSTSEVFGQHAFNVQEGHVTTIGSVGEARWTYAVSKLAGRAHGARVPRGARAAGGLGAAVQHLRPRPDRRGRDPRLHRGGARRPRSRDPRRRLPDPRLVLRRRHGRGRAARARAPGRRRGELQRRQRPLRGHDLRPRDAHQAPDRLPGRDPLRASALHRRRAPDPERRQGAVAARLRGARSSSTKGSPGRSRGTAPGSARRRERARRSGSPGPTSARPSSPRSRTCSRAAS